MARLTVSINITVRKEGASQDIINETVSQTAEQDVVRKMPWSLIMQEFWNALMERVSPEATP